MRRLSRPGDVVDGRFKLVSLLGEGASGAVWKAKDLGASGGDPLVAIKLLFDERARDARDLSRFVQEAKLLEAFQHPGIARLIAWNGGGPQVYMVIELLDGVSLEDHLVARASAKRHLTKEEIATRAGALTSAIGHAHAHGVVHRDLKPRNIIVEREGMTPFLKIVDFGIAKRLTGSEIDPTTAGRVLGSILYIAPEQSRGEAIDRRADLFALGTILFELATLRRAWLRGDDGRPLSFEAHVEEGERNSAVAVLRRIGRDPRPRASMERPDLPAGIDQALARAMAISPADRPSTAEDLQAALDRALASTSRIPAQETKPSAARVVPSFKKK
jgi:serine/threonine-protein kinase